MDRRELEEIERFLTSVGRPTLFAYYGLEPTADGAAAEEAVRKRRSWAQGQQSNPKYKSEALFVIKNNALLKRVFVEDLEAYRAHVRDDSSSRNLDVLTLFIKGTIAEGQLTPQAEAAILHQGRQLDLVEAAVVRRIEELLSETGATRVGFDADDLSSEVLAVDHYAILGIAPNASPSGIEEAYRSRYRWARNLKDLKRSAEILNALDQAWRVLFDPVKRARYDERRLQMLEMTDEVEKRAAVLLGLLGGPEDAINAESPLSGAPPPLVHEVGFRQASAPPVRPSAPLGTRLPDRTAPPGTPSPFPAPRSASPGTPLPPGGPPDATGAPPPAPPVPGRTIGLAPGPQTVATLGPRLVVEGPDVLSVQVGGRPATRRWVVRNAGQGRMPGRVVSDRDWLKVEPARLDATADSQNIAVTVFPAQLPWGRTAGTVTVVTDHGERRTMTVQVDRRSWLPIVAGVAVFGAVAAVAVAGMLYVTRTPKSTTLALTIDPVADHVYIDGQDLGGGQRFVHTPTRLGGPLTVRVEAEGFAPHEQIVALREGERTAHTIELALADDMSWTPPADASPAEAPPPLVAGVQAAAPALARCFSDAPGAPAATYTAWVTPDGQVRRVEVKDAEAPTDAALACLHKGFRGLRLPTFTGAYTMVEARLGGPSAP